MLYFYGQDKVLDTVLMCSEALSVHCHLFVGLGFARRHFPWFLGLSGHGLAIARKVERARQVSPQMVQHVYGKSVLYLGFT